MNIKSGEKQKKGNTRKWHPFITTTETLVGEEWGCGSMMKIINFSPKSAKKMAEKTFVIEGGCDNDCVIKTERCENFCFSGKAETKANERRKKHGLWI